MYQNSDLCWQIFSQKNTEYDGVFVVGVMSTKIYCRPSCSARPLRKNVRFFADNAQAEQAGLRPCKRCTPDSIPHDILLCHKACRYIESQTCAPSLSQIAQAVGYSQFHLQRTFKQVLGVSPFGYAQAIKWLRLQYHLTTQTSIQDAVRKAGFGSISSYYHAHAHHKQIAPSIRDNPLEFGTCQYADFTVVGVFSGTQIIYCGIYVDLISAGSAIMEVFGQPLSSISATHSDLLNHILTGQQNEMIDQTITNVLHSTVFQRRVWQAIRQIPIGSTQYYHEIATAIGQPTATRAVASACAQNPLAIITPCHRVIPMGNSVGEYRWGSHVKATLLNSERAHTYNGVANISKEHNSCD